MSLTTNTSATTTTHEDNFFQIPSDFLPRYKGSITFSYAMMRKSWAPAFDQQKFASLASPNHIDTKLENSWHQYMIKLYDEIKELGEYATYQQAIKIFRDEYQFVHPISKAEPKVIQDVFDIIEDKVWYHSEPKRTFNSIYMIMYGIFRAGFDVWILDAEKVWLKQKKLSVYETNKVRNSHSFVYQVMTTKASHNLQRIVKSTCTRAHGEFITCKLPQKKDGKELEYEENRIKYTKIKCNRWNAFLAQTRNSSNASHKIQLKNHITSLLNDSALSVDEVRECLISSISDFELKSEKNDGKFFFMLQFANVSDNV